MKKTLPLAVTGTVKQRLPKNSLAPLGKVVQTSPLTLAKRFKERVNMILRTLSFCLMLNTFLKASTCLKSLRVGLILTAPLALQLLSSFVRVILSAPTAFAVKLVLLSMW